MARRRVRLGAIDVARLENAFQPEHAVLLVELRTLRQVCDAIEVADLEEVASYLRPSRNDFGGEDLGEPAPRQRCPERVNECGLDPEYRRPALGTEGERTVAKHDLLRDMLARGR